MNKRFFVFSLLALMGCHKTHHVENIQTKKVDMTKSDEDSVIPSSLWLTFEKTFPELMELSLQQEGEGAEKEKKEEKEEPKKAPVKNSARVEEKKKEQEELLKRRPTLDGLPLTVQLIEKTQGVLDNNNYEISVGIGGATLDFKDYVPEKKNGTFFLKVKYDKPMDPKKARVFYLSNAPHRKDSKLGSGCNKYFEITKYWNGMMKEEGLTLNTVNLRHLSISAGTFFFVCPVNGKLRLGQLTIKDSRHRDLLCQPEIKL